jgi:hypothetical protein
MDILEAQDTCLEDRRLIGVIRSVKFGEITIKIRAGKPVVVEKGVVTIKLEEDRRMG